MLQWYVSDITVQAEVDHELLACHVIMRDLPARPEMLEVSGGVVAMKDEAMKWAAEDEGRWGRRRWGGEVGRGRWGWRGDAVGVGDAE